MVHSKSIILNNTTQNVYKCGFTYYVTNYFSIGLNAKRHCMPILKHKEKFKPDYV